jgi:hypothetical protein
MGMISDGPSNYGRNMLCGWDIRPSLADGHETCNLEIQFVEMSVEFRYDYVMVWDGGPLEQGGTLLARLSGSLPNDTTYRSSTCRLYVELRFVVAPSAHLPTQPHTVSCDPFVVGIATISDLFAAHLQVG